MKTIIQDIKSGALPLSEIPGFMLYMIGRTFWFWLALIFIGFVIVASR